MPQKYHLLFFNFFKGYFSYHFIPYSYWNNFLWIFIWPYMKKFFSPLCNSWRYIPYLISMLHAISFNKVIEEINETIFKSNRSKIYAIKNNFFYQATFFKQQPQ